MSYWRQKNFDPSYKPEELKYSELEEFLIPTFKVFTELGNRRAQGMNGPLPIAWTDMQAWQSMRRSRLEPWQVEAILRIDNAYLEVWFEQ